MLMTFGRYRGREIADLPNDYLVWAAGNLRRGALKDALRDAKTVECLRNSILKQLGHLGGAQ